MLRKRIDDGIIIEDHEEVKYKDCGNIKEIMYMAKRNRKNYLTKLDKDHYLDCRTGEVREYNHIDNRACNIATVKQSLAALRDLLNTNVTDVNKCRWVTLTYAENMTDTKRLYDDYKKFMKRFRYQYPETDYIVAMEPQGRGAWHCHVVIMWPDKAPYIPSTELSDIWGHGFVTVKRLDDVNNVGAYLTAYLGDMDFDEAKESGAIISDKLEIKEIEYTDEGGQKQTKKYIKGARLSMYPPGFNLYRYSRGMKKPVTEYMTCEKAKKKVSSAKLTFKSTVQITDLESGYQNIIQHEYYNICIKKGNTCE